MLDFSYPKILELFPQHLDPKRSESASFLIWYLENYYRLDTEDAVDFVCDQRGDKGVDGIFVNDSDQTITIFQSRILQDQKATVGDKGLREFTGTIAQFETAEKIENLIKSAGDAQVAALARRLDLVNKISTHDLRGEFVTNNEIDANGVAYLRGANHISFIGGTSLNKSFISNERDKPVHDAATFDISGFIASEYIVDKDTRAIIAPVRAAELVRMSGIANQSLFMYNVRGPLGRTQVNKDIVKTIEKKEWHKLFPLFHNGITVIAGQLKSDAQSIQVQDYFVVNGCQSLTALFNNAGKVTDDLRVLTKFIKMDPSSPLAAQITDFSNNQNPPKPRDSKSNNQLQIRLQNEFKKHYPGDYSFEIKQGESAGPNKITNEAAGLYLMAFDLEEPWATHRKYQIFEDKYSDLFGRPEVTAHRIVFLQVIMEEIQKLLPKIENGLFAKYALTRYLILYILRQLLETDEFGRMAISMPEKFVQQKKYRDLFREVVATMISDVIADVNAEVKNYGDNFDYRDKLRDDEYVKKLSGEVTSTYQKLINRKTIKSFKEEWESRLRIKPNGKGRGATA